MVPGGPVGPGQDRANPAHSPRTPSLCTPSPHGAKSWTMGIVAGLDSSSTSTRIVVCDADTGAVIRQGYAPHPVEKGPETDPQAWLMSLGEAAGGGLLEGVQAIGVSAQQHGLVPLDA